MPFSVHNPHTIHVIWGYYMKIENDLVVKIGDGEAIFDEPTLRDWAIMVELGDKTLEQQADILLPKLREIRGFEFKDGTEVTVEDLKDKKFSAKFFMMLLKGWSKAIVDGLKDDAEGKNVQTVN